jgi:hypothetical protein
MKRHTPLERECGVGYRPIISQNTGIASFPHVTFRRVTATRTFQGSSETFSARQCKRLPQGTRVCFCLESIKVSLVLVV